MINEITKVLNVKTAQKLFSLIPEKKILTVKEAELVIIVGHALKHVMDQKVVKKLLSYLPYIQEIEIQGLPKESSQKILMNWIIQYYKVLYLLLDHIDISTKYIEKCLSAHIFTRKDEIISKFIQNSQKNHIIGIELEAWGLNRHISIELGRAILQTIYYRYLRGCKTDIKFTEVHSRIISLILAVIKNQPSIIEEDNSIISEVFKLTFKFANKYLNKTISSKKLFTVCVDYQLYCLTFHKILELGLKDFNLKSVYGKNPLVNCWMYYTSHLLEMMNLQILVDILNIFLVYIPDLNETEAGHVVLGYFDMIAICKYSLREFGEKLLTLAIDVMRSQPKSLEILKARIMNLPDYIRDDAKWAYVYLKLSDEEVPRIIHDSFKSLQSKEEALHVFSILSDRIPNCEFGELELILKELSKISHSKEIIEFLTECVVIMIKQLERIGNFEKFEDINHKLKIIIAVLGEKAKDISRSKVFNKFWMYFMHFQVQTGLQHGDIKKSLEHIAAKTIWERTKANIQSSSTYVHKLRLRLKRFNTNTIKLSYIELLWILVNCEILIHQYSCEFFLESCLKSTLPEGVQDILVSEYFEALKSSKFSLKRISGDLKFLLTHFAQNPNREFIEALINSDSISNLNSCYTFQFIQIQLDFDFFSFSLNLYGCSALQNPTEVALHHSNSTLLITNPVKFFKFLSNFMAKTVAYGLCIAKPEILFNYTKFMQKCNKSAEDSLSQQFMKDAIRTFTTEKVSFKAYYDLMKFHKWFLQKFSVERFLSMKKKRKKVNKNECKIAVVGLNSRLEAIARILVDSKVSTQEFYRLIYEFVRNVFESNLFFLGLKSLDSIISANLNNLKIIFNFIKILMLEYLQITTIKVKKSEKNYLFHTFTTKSQISQPYLSDTSLSHLIRFLERQFHMCVMYKTNEHLIISVIFERILSNCQSRSPLLVLELCTICLRISRPIFQLKNSYQLHVLSLRALLSLHSASFENKQKYLDLYIKLMKVLFKQLVISIIPSRPSKITTFTINPLPELLVFHQCSLNPVEFCDYSMIESIMYVLSVNLFTITSGENQLPSLKQSALKSLLNFPSIYSKLCSYYNQVPELHQNSKSYEEQMYLFSPNPGYSVLLEYLSSPLSSAKSFAVKHFKRAVDTVKIVYIPKLILLLTVFEDKPRVENQEDLYTLLTMLALSSAVCAVRIISCLDVVSIYNRRFQQEIPYRIKSFILDSVKKEKFIWEEFVEINSFVNNIWLIVEGKNFKERMKKMFRDENDVCGGLILSISPEFLVKSIEFKPRVIEKSVVFRIGNKENVKKSIGFQTAFENQASAAYFFIFKVVLSHFKSKGLPLSVKLQNIEIVRVRSKEEYGAITEFCEIFPYEYQDIINSHACSSLLLFLLGLKPVSPDFSVSSHMKIIINTSKLLIAPKNHLYFKCYSNLEQYKYWVISGYIACREIFENLLWTMKESIWKSHKLHFYLTLPISSAVDRINQRISKDNSLAYIN